MLVEEIAIPISVSRNSWPGGKKGMAATKRCVEGTSVNPLRDPRSK